MNFRFRISIRMSLINTVDAILLGKHSPSVNSTTHNISDDAIAKASVPTPNTHARANDHFTRNTQALCKLPILNSLKTVGIESLNSDFVRIVQLCVVHTRFCSLTPVSYRNVYFNIRRYYHRPCIVVNVLRRQTVFFESCYNKAYTTHNIY